MSAQQTFAEYMQSITFAFEEVSAEQFLRGAISILVPDISSNIIDDFMTYAEAPEDAFVVPHMKLIDYGVCTKQ